MRLPSKRFAMGLGLSAGMVLLTGCRQVSQLKLLFAKRSTENLPPYKPVDVHFLN